MANLIVLVIAVLLLVPLILLLTVSGLLLRSFGWSLPSFREVGQLLFRRDTKRNLALAHATINHLEGEHGPTRIVARAAPTGFRLDRVPFTEQVVAQAAVQARRRLLAGEGRLRFRPRDPGSTVIAVALGWALALGLLLAARARLQDALIALLLVLLLKAPLGRAAQRWLTTRHDVSRLQIGPCQPYNLSAAQVLGTLVTEQPAASFWVSTFPAIHPADQPPGARVRVTVRPLKPGPDQSTP